MTRPAPTVTVPVELAETPAIRNTLGLLRSAILCGEQWSDACKDAYLAALKELDQLAMLAAAPAAPQAAGVGEDLAGKLTGIRDKFLTPTPDKDFTDYAILTRCIEDLREREGEEEIGAECDAAAYCVTLAECPPGLFLWNGTLGFKSEYGAMEPDDATNGKFWKVGNRVDAYCADSGEYFWGGTSNHDDRAKLLVYPIDAATVAMVASHGPSALRAPSREPEGGAVATGAQAVVRNGQIVISVDVDALPIILSGSIALNAVAGTFKVTDAATFAKEVCHALNAEKEDGTTRVHMMFDSAFNHAIGQGCEGVEEISEDEFEAEAARLQAEATSALATREEAPAEAGAEGEAWKWIAGCSPNDAPSDLAYDANEMVDAFMAGRSSALRAQPQARSGEGQ